MKRRELLRYLARHGCALVREGSDYSWCGNPVIALPISRHSLDVRMLTSNGIPLVQNCGQKGPALALVQEGRECPSKLLATLATIGETLA